MVPIRPTARRFLVSAARRAASFSANFRFFSCPFESSSESGAFGGAALTGSESGAFGGAAFTGSVQTNDEVQTAVVYRKARRLVVASPKEWSMGCFRKGVLFCGTNATTGRRGVPVLLLSTANHAILRERTKE